MNRYPSLISSATVSTVSILSSCSIGIRLIILVPLAVLPASGISYALFLYTLPLFVKNNTSEWVEVIKTFSTKSSSFVVIAWIPLPPLLWAEYVSAEILLIYPELVNVITTSSSWIKSSMSISLTTFWISVLLSSLYLLFISLSSSLITPRSFISSANILFKYSMYCIISLSSSSILSLSRPVNLLNLISKIAWACFSLNWNLSINVLFAISLVFEFLIIWITSSILSRAIFNPSNMCALASALFNSNTVLLVTTSFWNSI